MKEESKISTWTAYLTLATLALYIITGYGITQFRIVEVLTFGLLDKPLSFKIHSNLIYPLIIFLAIHLYCSCSVLNWLKKK